MPRWMLQFMRSLRASEARNERTPGAGAHGLRPAGRTASDRSSPATGPLRKPFDVAELILVVAGPDRKVKQPSAGGRAAMKARAAAPAGTRMPARSSCSCANHQPRVRCMTSTGIAAPPAGSARRQRQGRRSTACRAATGRLAANAPSHPAVAAPSHRAPSSASAAGGVLPQQHVPGMSHARWATHPNCAVAAAHGRCPRPPPRPGVVAVAILGRAADRAALAPLRQLRQRCRLQLARRRARRARRARTSTPATAAVPLLPAHANPARPQRGRQPAVLEPVELAKRRLVSSLIGMKLPLASKGEDPAHGLVFDLLSATPDAPVVTGHATA